METRNVEQKTALRILMLMRDLRWYSLDVTVLIKF